jgi:hypothetical protein
MLPNRISIFKTVRWAIYIQLRGFLSLLNVKKRISLNSIWRNIAKPNKREVIIIGGGPSFTQEISNKIIECQELFNIVAINFYCLNDQSKKLIPDYYVLSDPAHLNTKHAATIEKNNQLKSYLKKNRCKLLAPYGADWDEYSHPFATFNDTENLFTNNINPRSPRGYTSNTMFKAIALMRAIGFEKIYVVGFDFDYPRKLFLDKNNTLFLKEEHHYNVVNSDYSNVFDSVGHALHWWAQDYWHLKKLSTPRVINVTETSMIDAFQRMTPKDFIETIGNQ